MTQLYMMRHDGGEARKITDAEDGVTGFDFSPDVVGCFIGVGMLVSSSSLGCLLPFFGHR